MIEKTKGIIIKANHLYIIVFALFMNSCAEIYDKTSLTYHVVNVAKDDALNVRKYPSHKAPVVGELTPDMSIPLHHCKRVDDDSVWCLIEEKNVATGSNTKGWVDIKYIAPYTSKTYVKLLKGKLPVTVYKSPHIFSRKISKINRVEDCYYVLECKNLLNDTWCHVFYGMKGQKEKNGWIKRENIIASNQYDAKSIDSETEGFCAGLQIKLFEMERSLEN